MTARLLTTNDIPEEVKAKLRAEMRDPVAPTPSKREWRPIADAFADPGVYGEQRTLFIARFGKEEYPSFNCVYYDPMLKHPFLWNFADGGGAYHKEWPTHWMFAEDAAANPVALTSAKED